MQKTIHLGTEMVKGAPIPSTVSFSILILDHLIDIPQHDFRTNVVEAIDSLIAEGVHEDKIVVGIGIRVEDGYGDDRASASVNVTGSRPATPAEVEEERMRREQRRERERTQDIARMKDRIARLEGRS